MVHESLNALKFDLRLQNRRGWISQAEQDTHLESLPDVADKGEVVGDEPPVSAPVAESPSSGFEAAPAPGAPAAPEAPAVSAPPVTSTWGGSNNDV